MPGDRITFGDEPWSIAIDVVDSEAAAVVGTTVEDSAVEAVKAEAVDPSSPGVPVGETCGTHQSPPPTDAKAAETLSEQASSDGTAHIQQVQSASRIARTRCRELLRSLREARSNIAELQAISLTHQVDLETAQEEQQQLTSQLELLRAEANKHEAQLAEEKDHWQAEFQKATEQLAQAETAASEHEADRERWQSELATVEAERERLHEENVLQTSRCEDLDSLIAERNGRIEELDAELESLRTGLHQSEQTATDTASDLEHLRNEVAELSSIRDQLTSELEHSNRRGEELEQSLADRDGRLEQLQGEQETLRDELRQAEESVSKQLDEIEHLRTTCSSLESAHEKLTSEQLANDERLQAQEVALTERDGRIVELHEELDSVRRQLEEASQGTTVFQEEMEKLRSEIASLEAQREQWTTAQSTNDERIHELEEVISERDRRLSDLGDELQSAHEQVAQQEQKSVEQAEQFSRLEEERNNFENKQAEWLAEKEQLAAIHSQQVEQLQAVQQVLNDRNTRIEQLLGELEEAQKPTPQIEELSKQHAEQETAALSEIDHLQTELESLRAEIDQAHERAAQLQHERETLQTQLQEACQEHEARESQCAKLESGYSELASQWTEKAEGWQQEKEGLGQQLSSQSTHIKKLESDLQEARSQADRSAEQLAEIHRRHDEVLSKLHAAQQEIGLLQEEVGRFEAIAEDREKAETVVAREEGADTHEADRASEPVEPLTTDAEAEQAIARLRELSIWNDDAEPESDSSSLHEHEAANPDETNERPESPVSFIDRYQQQYEEDADQEYPTAEQPAETAIPDAVETSPEAPSAVHEASDSDDALELEDYLADLMKRMQGSPDASDAENESKWQAPDSASSEELHELPEDTTENYNRVIDALRAAGQEPGDILKSASAKSTQPINLAALRELANTSAQQAVATYHKRRHSETAISKAVTCTAALSTAVFLFFKAPDHRSMLFVCGCVAATAALFWGLQLLGVLLQVIRTGSWEETVPAELPLDENPLPIAGPADNHAASEK